MNMILIIRVLVKVANNIPKI